MTKSPDTSLWLPRHQKGIYVHTHTHPRTRTLAHTHTHTHTPHTPHTRHTHTHSHRGHESSSHRFTRSGSENWHRGARAEARETNAGHSIVGRYVEGQGMVRVPHTVLGLVWLCIRSLLTLMHTITGNGDASVAARTSANGPPVSCCGKISKVVYRVFVVHV